MANNTINVDLKLRSNTKTETANAKDLNAELNKSKDSVIAYNKARAVSASTGASARSFSREAQGLGGLVQTYAILAANTYAVAAAFNILSDAMDTSIMIKSMDALGASSGMALGSLSKKLVEASQGALSLRESMEVVSKGTAAGISAKQLENLTKVAGNASKALGLNMTDAMSRLIRGVSKIEPELLDELGIFTKIEPAVNDYARAIGKTAGSLTDFERRQAFLVAVLKEGNDKFKEVEEIGVNTYTKLGAKLKDTLLVTLESVNKLVVPLVSFLSESPTALYTVLLGIGAILIKQILPGVTAFREGLKQTLYASSAEALKNVEETQRAVALRQGLANKQALTAAEAQADALNTAAEKSQKKLENLKKKGKNLTPGVQEIISQGIVGPEMKDARFKELRKEISASAGSPQERKAQTEFINILEKEKIASNNYQKVIQENEQKTISALEKSRQVKNEQILLNRSLQKSIAAVSLEEVESNTRRLGFSEAIKRGRADIAERRAGPTIRELPIQGPGGTIRQQQVLAPQLGRVAAGFQTVKVAATAATSAISSALSAFSPWLMVIAAALPLLSILGDKLLGNTKQIAATSEAFDTLTSNITAANKTIELLGKNSDNILSVNNLNASATALSGMTESLLDFVNKAQKEIQSGGGVYKFIESIQNMWGGGTKGDIAKGISEALDSAIQLSGTNTEPLRKELTNVLKLPLEATFSSIELAAKKADPETQVQLAKALVRVGLAAKEAVQPTKELLDAFTQTGKVFDTFIASVLPSTGLGKWAYDGLINMQAFRKEIGDVATDIGALNDIVKSPGDLIKKFGIEGSAAIIPLIGQIKELNTGYTETINKLSDLDKSELASRDANLAKTREGLKKAQERLASNDTESNRKAVSTYKEQIKRQIKFREDAMAASTQRQPLLGKKAEQEAQIKDLFSRFDDISAKSAAEFARLFETELGNSAAKARLSINKALTGYVQDVGVKAKLELINTTEEIRIEKDKVTQTINLIKAMEANKISIERNTNELAQKRVTDDKNISQPEKDESLKRLRIEARSLELRSETLANPNQANAQKIIQARAVSGRGGPAMTEQSEETQAAKKALAASTSVGLAIRSAEGNLKQLDASLVVAKNRQIVEGAIADVYDKRGRALNNELESLKTSRTEAEKLAESDTDRLSKINAIDADILKKENEIKLVRLDQNVAVANYLAFLNKGNPLYAQSLATSISILETQKNQNQEAERLKTSQLTTNENLAKISEKYKDINNSMRNQATITEANRKLEDVGVERAKLKFEAEASLGKFTAQQLQDKRTQNSLDEISLGQARQIEDANTAITDKLSKLNEEYAKARELNNKPEQERIISQIRATAESYGINIEAINKLNAAKRESILITNSLTEQQKGFADIFTKGFESMADAMADFVKTGKIDFKGLINSMIMDLIRFQLRSQMQELAGPGGGANLFAKILSSALGSRNNYSSGTPDFTKMTLEQQSITMAKGGAFANGVREFAKGGAFTNSIVNSPTLFKFAKGTGLMGEAGPEAIMPLKRDATGNLGVRSNQQKVDIVVNNYSGQKAETTETTDARGNRKIEVVVGEMTAGDISKPGSSSQRALRSNYGLEPALVRR